MRAWRPQLTEAKPLPELAGRARLDEPLVKVPGEVVYHGIHVGFHDEDRRGGVVADDGALHPGVLRALHLAEQMVLNLAIDNRATVLVEVRLDPLGVRAVDNLGDLRVVDVDEVGADPNDGAVLVVELLDGWAIVGSPGLVEPPKIRPT